MSRVTSYTNSPSPKLLRKIGATNLILADAIAEIVANSFDAALDGEPTIVEVQVVDQEICVVDNGAGMTEDVLVEAVKLGVDMADVVKKPQGAKGRFGLGMKTACASIGHWWAVYTRPLGARSEFRVVFDLAEWERRPDVPDAWTIEVEELDLPTDSPLGDREHGTAVVVKKLRQRDPLAGAVLSKLGEAFKPHLQQGDSILVNGDPATPHNYDFVANSKVPIDITFGPSDELQITGWVAIDKKTHNDGDYGFNIYRYGQLVQTWCQDWFAAHLMTSRIIGEVNMDFIDATFFKQGLQKVDLWRQASAEMKEFMKPVVKASRALGREGKIHSPVLTQQIVGEMYDGLGLEPLGGRGPAFGGEAGDSQPDDSQPKRELPKLRVDLESLILEDGSELSISLVEKELSTGDTPFDFLLDTAGMALLAVLNTNHPLFLKTKDLEQLRVLAIADSVLRFLVDECGMSGRKAAEIRSEWVLKRLQAPAEAVCT